MSKKQTQTKQSAPIEVVYCPRSQSVMRSDSSVKGREEMKSVLVFCSIQLINW